MKKVAFLCCLFCGLITQAVGATYNCKAQKIDSHTSKESGAYMSLDSEFGEGYALVCGGTDGCEHGTMVLAYYRGDHYQKGTGAHDGGLYMCDTSGGSSWEPVLFSGLDECSGEPKKGTYKIPIDDFYLWGRPRVNDFANRFIILQDPCVTKEGSTPSDDSSPAASEEKKTDTEKTEQNTKQNQPVQNQSGDAEKKSETTSAQGAKQTQPGGAGKKSETTSAQGTKQTQPGGAGEKSGKKPGQGASSSDASGTGATGTGATGTGTSGAGTSTQNQSGGAGEKSGKKPAQGASSSGASGTGATGAGTSGQGAKQNQPGGGEKKSEKKPEQGAKQNQSAQTKSGGGTSGQAQPTAPEVKKSQCELNKPGWLVFEGRCITDAQYQNILAERQAAKVRALAQKIESAASQLDSMSSRFKVSVWKDAEGKFNTARLASDSIAGVVLGTAGGLITSHVVKKNQVENGFQDIKCTIGGQSVANWGDEFSVGIQ